MGDYSDSQNPKGGYGGSQQPGPSPTNAPPKPPPKPPAPRPIVSDIRLHFYLSTPQGMPGFLKFLNHSWDNTGLGPFDPFGVTMTPFEDVKKGLEDFKKSIATSGTIVVYMGHTSLVEKSKKVFVAEGLAPEGAKKTILKNAALVGLLEKAKANIVILAGCATDACIPAKLKNGVIVITTASGRDGVTHSAYWARALTGFLLALVGWKFDGQTVTQLASGTATVQEAIAIGNKLFPAGDSFVLSSGDGSVREF
jgi:hypothetical protein